MKTNKMPLIIRLSIRIIKYLVVKPIGLLLKAVPLILAALVILLDGAVEAEKNKKPFIESYEKAVRRKRRERFVVR